MGKAAGRGRNDDEVPQRMDDFSIRGAPVEVVEPHVDEIDRRWWR
jgi:hypothetical protein